MEKRRAIPPGYMTVGEIAGKMGATVRALQHYDREGILSPSLESEGGRRLYTHRDIVRLHQIQSMKYLGFSLADIKTRLPAFNTPKEVSAALDEQARGFREKIKSMQEALESIEKLGAEVAQMETVDWEVYADIVLALQAKDNAYWLMKHLDDDLSSHVRNSFGRKTREQMHKRYKRMMRRIAEAQKSGLGPESDQVQAIAKEMWDFLMWYSDGDIGMIQEISRLSDGMNDDEWKGRFDFDKKFMGKMMQIYCEGMESNPLLETGTQKREPSRHSKNRALREQE